MRFSYTLKCAISRSRSERGLPCARPIISGSGPCLFPSASPRSAKPKPLPRGLWPSGSACTSRKSAATRPATASPPLMSSASSQSRSASARMCWFSRKASAGRTKTSGFSSRRQSVHPGGEGRRTDRAGVAHPQARRQQVHPDNGHPTRRQQLIRFPDRAHQTARCQRGSRCHHDRTTSVIPQGKLW